jgi:hypothetical protein
VTWLTAIELGLLLIALLSMSRQLFQNSYFGVFAFTAFLANPLLLSTIGLDSILYTLLLVTSLAAFLHRRPWALGLVLGLLTLTRPEGILFAAICIAVFPAPLRERWKIAVPYCATLLPWAVFSWVYLGSFVPDTLLIKKNLVWVASFAGGPRLYWTRYPMETAIAVFLLPAAALACRYWRLPRCTRKMRMIMGIVGSYAALHFAAYSLLGVPPYHWYYTHQVIAIVLIGSIGVALLVQRWSPWQFNLTSACVALSALTPLLGVVYLGYRDGFPFKEPPIHTNWATQRRYTEVALWLKEYLDPSAVVETTGEIGTLAFFSERYLRNEFTDMNIPTGWVATAAVATRPYIGWAFRTNFYWRTQQPPLATPSYRLDGVPVADDSTEVDDVVKSWATSTRWEPNGRLYLRRMPQAQSLEGSRPAARLPASVGTIPGDRR